MDGTTVLITGATGFIGSRVTALMAGAGISVVATGRSPAALEALARGLASGPRTVRTGIIDWTDRGAAETAARFWPGVTHIVHLASPVPGPGGETVGLLSDGCAQTLNLLRAADMLAVRHLTFVSSASVYGRAVAGCVDETAPLSPDVGAYGQMKRMCEEAARWWARERGATLAVLRPSQVYGPGEPHGRGLTAMIRSALAGEALTLHCEGRDVRDFVFVDDAAAAVVDAVRRGAAGVFNVSSGTGFSVREMAACIVAAVGRNVPVSLEPSNRPATTTVFDNAAAVRNLGLHTTPLADGIAATVAAERSRREGRA